MRVLVTGGAGFIGSHIVDALVDDGHEVSVVDDLTSGREADLNPGARLFNVDITHYDDLHQAFEAARPEVVHHLAAQSTVARSMEDPYGDSLVNVGGTINVLRLCVKSGAGRIVFASSSAVYGDPSYVPMDETHPVNAYGRSKLAGEKVLETTNARWAVVRTSWLYGPDRKDFIDVILGARYRSSPLKIVNDQVGCPTWTDSLAPALVELAERGAIGTYHLCDRGKATWLDLARGAAICANLDVELEATTTEAWGAPADRPRYSVLDSSKAEALLGRSMPMWGESLREHLEAIE